MSRDIIGDSILGDLGALSRATPSAQSTARTRRRAHAMISQARREQHHQRASRYRLLARAIDGAVVLVCVVYLSGTVAQALRLLAQLR
jgi:RNase P/RNase MRP subunit POP5